MRALKLSLLMILLTGSAAAQSSSTVSDPSGVTVLNINWRRVEPVNPKLNDRILTNADSGARRAVNTARTNEANSARENGLNPPPPALLTYPASPEAPPVVRPWSGYICEVTVKNTGAKTIRQLVFDYSFTDPRTQRTVGHRQFKSKVKIHPGMTAKVAVRTSSRPVGTVAAAPAGPNQPAQSAEQIVIQKIKYADGSVWQRSAK